MNTIFAFPHIFAQNNCSIILSPIHSTETFLYVNICLDKITPQITMQFFPCRLALGERRTEIGEDMKRKDLGRRMKQTGRGGGWCVLERGGGDKSSLTLPFTSLFAALCITLTAYRTVGHTPVVSLETLRKDHCVEVSTKQAYSFNAFHCFSIRSYFFY